MVTCAKCGTGWTSSGLPICPVCGTRVDSEARARGTALQEIEAPPPKAEAPRAELPAELQKVESEVVLRAQPADPSAASLPVVRNLPVSPRPMIAPLVLGILSFVGGVLFPWTLVFEGHRVLGVLGFCMTGFFAPFAPIAWMAGMSAEKRRREQGLRIEGPVSLGRRLGQIATLLLVSELTLALIAIAALRLSGKFPVSFWNAPF